MFNEFSEINEFFKSNVFTQEKLKKLYDKIDQTYSGDNLKAAKTAISLHMKQFELSVYSNLDQKSKKQNGVKEFNELLLAAEEKVLSKLQKKSIYKISKATKDSPLDLLDVINQKGFKKNLFDTLSIKEFNILRGYLLTRLIVPPKIKQPISKQEHRSRYLSFLKSKKEKDRKKNENQKEEKNDFSFSPAYKELELKGGPGKIIYIRSK